MPILNNIACRMCKHLKVNTDVDNYKSLLGECNAPLPFWLSKPPFPYPIFLTQTIDQCASRAYSYDKETNDLRNRLHEEE